MELTMGAGRLRLRRYAFAFLAGVTGTLGSAHAGVVVDGTRVIYPSSKREVSLNLHNDGAAPALVQTWIDAGDPKARQGAADVPFVITPPLFRLEPQKGQTLRVIFTQAPLPMDRESVFWLNVLDIPPRAPANPDAPNHLEMAFRHRMKLFFRPVGLKGDAGAAPSAVQWSIVNENGIPALEAQNRTAYFVSFAGAELVTAGSALAIETDMVPPFASKHFVLPQQGAQLRGNITVKYKFVNDYGALTSGEAPVGIAAR